MKKKYASFILFYCLFAISVFSQQEKIILDVEDKEIATQIDFDKLQYFYANIIHTMLAEDRQENAQGDEKQHSKIQSLKIAFLSSKLDLKVAESETFWPVYNEYVEELKKTKDETNEIEKDEKVLDIRKRYKQKFDKIMNADKTNTLFKAEKEFKHMMQESIMMQKFNKHKERSE